MRLPITILLIAICFFCKGQSKGDNTIIINAPVKLDNVKSIFFQNGYVFENSDTVYINTSAKEISSAPMILKILVQRRDTITYIKGLTKSTMTLNFSGTEIKDDFDFVYFGGEKKSPIRKVWNELQRVSLLLSDKITYTKQ